MPGCMVAQAPRERQRVAGVETLVGSWWPERLHSRREAFAQGLAPLGTAAGMRSFKLPDEESSFPHLGVQVLTQFSQGT